MIDVEVGGRTTRLRAQTRDIKYVLCSAGIVSLTFLLTFDEVLKVLTCVKYVICAKKIRGFYKRAELAMDGLLPIGLPSMV